MLGKLTTGFETFNFINRFTADFLPKIVLHSFSLVAVWLCNFWYKNVGAKADHKILMKLIAAVNYLKKLFTHQKVKK